MFGELAAEDANELDLILLIYCYREGASLVVSLLVDNFETNNYGTL